MAVGERFARQEGRISDYRSQIERLREQRAARKSDLEAEQARIQTLREKELSARNTWKGGGGDPERRAYEQARDARRAAKVRLQRISGDLRGYDRRIQRLRGKVSTQKTVVGKKGGSLPINSIGDVETAADRQQALNLARATGPDTRVALDVRGRVIASGPGSEFTREQARSLSDFSAAQAARAKEREQLRASRDVTASAAFGELYAEREPGIRQYYAEERERSIQSQAREVSAWPTLASGSSIAASTASGEGVEDIQVTPVGATSFEDRRVLYYQDLRDQQAARGIAPTTLQRRAGRAAGALRGFATRRYAAASQFEPGTFNQDIRVAAGDAAAFVSDPLQRYAFGDPALGREITIGAATGLALGGAVAAGSTAAGRAVTFGSNRLSSRLPALALGRAAERTVTYGSGAILVGAGAASLRGRTPQEIGGELPFIASGIAGGVAGARLFSTPRLASQSPAEYLGIPELNIRPAARQSVRYSPEGIATSGSRTQQRIYSIYGRPVRGTEFTRTSFSGDTLAGIDNLRIYEGGLFTERVDAFRIRGRQYSIRQSSRGTGFLDFAGGRSAYRTPTETQLSQISLSATRPDGSTGQIGTSLIRRDGQVFGQNWAQRLSPDVISEIPTATTVTAVRGPGRVSVGPRAGTATERIFTARSVRSDTRRISRVQANDILNQLYGPRTGIPRSAVQDPQVTRLYADPTGGIASSLARPRLRPPRPQTIQTPRSTPGLRPPRIGIGLSYRTTPSSALIPATRSTARSLQSPITALSQRSTAATRTAPQIRTANIVTPDSISRLYQAPSIRTVTEARVTTRTDLREPARPITPVPGFQDLPPPPPPPPGFGFFPTLPLAALDRANERRGRGRTQAFGYNPSLAAFFGAGTGRRSTRSFTGIEIRPL